MAVGRNLAHVIVFSAVVSEPGLFAMTASRAWFSGAKFAEAGRSKASSGSRIKACLIEMDWMVAGKD
jgi:hypothetical protein